MSVSNLARSRRKVEMKRSGFSLSAYYRWATAAAAAEKDGDYVKAASCWGKAGRLAVKQANVVWSGERIEFCQRAAAHGWGARDAG